MSNAKPSQSTGQQFCLSTPCFHSKCRCMSMLVHVCIQKQLSVAR